MILAHPSSLSRFFAAILGRALAWIAVLVSLSEHSRGAEKQGGNSASLLELCGPTTELPPTTLPLTLKPGARVVLIGNTLFERMQDHAWFEAMLFRRLSRDDLVVRTLAWPADEIDLMPRPDKYADLHAHLQEQKADVILAAFGFNESFRGIASIADFQRKLAGFIVSLKLRRYNGTAPPQIVLVSPIWHENLGNPNLPDGRASNERLRAYTAAMAEVAGRCGVAFVDAFEGTRAAMEAPGKSAPLTSNGIHLTDDGYRQFAQTLFHGLFGEAPPAVPPSLKTAVEERNRHFLNKYRPGNMFYFYGGRRNPYGVVSFPPEFAKLDALIAESDRRIWDIAQDKKVAPPPLQSVAIALPQIVGDKPVNKFLSPEDELRAFTIDPRFEVNLFASADQFPDLAKPIQIRWDARGRLWVSCSTTYPQVLPGALPDDKIVILEDTDGDGRADKCSVFADKLHIPLSFEFADEGIYVSEQPHLTFLKDTDGDGRADVRRIVLTGFGTEDSHHALHDFAWDPAGDLIFRESVFLHSGIETPHGPVRTTNGSFFRFRPDTQRLIPFGSYSGTNPWGITFDQWGWHLGSHPVFANAVYALNPPYPAQQLRVENFINAFTGTCGQEFIYSRHFPDELQGCYVRVRYKHVNTVELSRWVQKDTHYEERKLGLLWQSKDLSFIPTDVRFGPRGDLYICDWYNPAKGHDQYSLRDTRRDKSSGRIWRVTAKGRPLSSPPLIAGQPIPALLDLLKSYEYRTRYTAKIELRERDAAQVRVALDTWLAALESSDSNYQHHALEALWMYRSLGVVKAELLVQLLHASNENVRAAAMRELRWWHPSVPDPIALLGEGANDANGLVRLEAAITASYFSLNGDRRSEQREKERLVVQAVDAALDLLRHPMDSALDYALRTTLDATKPIWEKDGAFLVKRFMALQQFIAKTDAPPQSRVAPPPAKDPFDALNPALVEIGTVPEQMRFTLEKFSVKAGAPIKLVFTNSDSTPHNIIICQPGSANAIGEAAAEMAKLPEAVNSMNFVPRSDKIVIASKMLTTRTTDTLRFRAPTQPGQYPFICSFPGHYILMRGTMIVQ